MEHFFYQFLENIQAATAPEWIAVVSGILSVWFSRAGNVLVYPVGIIGTVIYVYISVDAHLGGEAAVNLYYTIMSVAGWFRWTRRDELSNLPRPVSYSSDLLVKKQFVFFAVCFLAVFLSLKFLKQHFWPGAVPVFDGLAAATAFTGMWLMTLKKVESWYWWIATNILSVPLYAMKGLSLTSAYYFILLLLAFAGLREWKRIVANERV